jgi:hypothetical protein
MGRGKKTNRRKKLLNELNRKVTLPLEAMTYLDADITETETISDIEKS